MEKYSVEFKNLMIKGDLQEDKEQSIPCWFVFQIARVKLQLYHALPHVMKLALKVVPLNNYRSSTTMRSIVKEGFVKRPTSWNPSGT